MMNDKKNNGFTLVELLAVIAIIGILSVVAISAYGNVAKNSKQKAYESKVKQIESAAYKWAKENNVSNKISVSVNKLVVEGYLTADESDETGLAKISNPTNNENMICKTVDVLYKNGEIEPKYNEKENCTLAEQALNDNNIKVMLVAANTNKKLGLYNDTAEWSKEDVSIIVSSDKYNNDFESISYDYEGNTYVKYKDKLTNYDGSLYVANDDVYYNVFTVKASVIADVNVIITYNLKADSKINNDNTSRKVNIRIDKEEATMVANTTSSWARVNQNVNLSFDDGNGSGVYGYYVSDNPVSFNSDSFKNVISSDVFKPTKIGTYYFWTQDIAGNVSSRYKAFVDVNNIDNVDDSCTISFGNNVNIDNWLNFDVTPSMSTSSESAAGLYYGMNKTNVPEYPNYTPKGQSGSMTLPTQGSTGKNGVTYYCYIKTISGKTTSNSATVYIDKDKPTISRFNVVSSDSSYASNVVNASLNASDGENGSGISKMCIQTNNNVNSCNWVDYNNLYTGLSTGKDYDGSGLSFYAWVKDNAGNVSDMASTYYTVYKYCDDTLETGAYCSNDWSACSDACGGIRYATEITDYVDEHFPSRACSSTTEVNGCSEECGGWKDEAEDPIETEGKCTVASGKCSGTKTNTITTYTYSEDGSKICDTKVETETEKCSKGTPDYGEWSAWSSCSNACGGTQTKTRTVTLKKANGKKCKDKGAEYTQTKKRSCGGTKKKCEGWSTYGICTQSGKKCSEGTHSRSRTCYYMSSNGKKYCKKVNSAWKAYKKKSDVTFKDTQTTSCDACCSVKNYKKCKRVYDCRCSTYIHSDKSVSPNTRVGTFGEWNPVCKTEAFYVVKDEGGYYYGRSAGGVVGWVLKSCTNSTGSYCANVSCKN